MPPESTSYVEQIGAAAGEIWHLLNAQGPQSLAKLTKQVSASPTIAQHAIGWLAREGKVEFTENGRTRLVALR